MRSVGKETQCVLLLGRLAASKTPVQNEWVKERADVSWNAEGHRSLSEAMLLVSVMGQGNVAS